MTHQCVKNPTIDNKLNYTTSSSHYGNYSNDLGIKTARECNALKTQKIYTRPQTVPDSGVEQKKYDTLMYSTHKSHDILHRTFTGFQDKFMSTNQVEQQKAIDSIKQCNAYRSIVHNPNRIDYTSYVKSHQRKYRDIKQNQTPTQTQQLK